MPIRLYIAVLCSWSAIVLDPLNATSCYRENSEINPGFEIKVCHINSASWNSMISNNMIYFDQESLDLNDEIFFEPKYLYFNFLLLRAREQEIIRKNNIPLGSALLYCELDLPPPIYPF